MYEISERSLNVVAGVVIAKDPDVVTELAWGQTILA